eukprot:CAMPEP_0204840522 /NCGR_PEP_ID=MMETSP1346-20131115/38077_1 /ASSEMBLY_ACC=CAM_ASM_000771 /TAXON_ID=215587 /ORGANISM="Aplanochytrium stocchinoi, Strain GSBS06" /LENGTH=239 /DNA_ID=CAMNT_0051977981 /DNA_START=161 /DNA_END=880 /DNA_ORIENTATION=+
MNDQRGTFTHLKKQLLYASRQDVVNALTYLNIPPSRYLIEEKVNLTVATNCPNYTTWSSTEYGHLNIDYHRALVGQINNRNQCHKMITEHEKAEGKRFDYVIYARPDLTIGEPLLPWCRIMGDPKTLGYKDIRIKYYDFIFAMSRNHMDSALREPYVKYWSCKANHDKGAWVEHWFSKYGNTDIFTDEHLNYFRGVIPTAGKSKEQQRPRFCTNKEKDKALDVDTCKVSSYLNECNKRP